MTKAAKKQKKTAKKPDPSATDLGKLPKISASLLTFASPLLDTLPQPRQVEHLRHAVNIAMIAWNLPIMEHQKRGAEMRALYERHMQLAPPAIKALLDRMMSDRMARWGHDPRLVGEIDVRRDGDELIVNVTARLFRGEPEQPAAPGVTGPASPGEPRSGLSTPSTTPPRPSFLVSTDAVPEEPGKYPGSDEILAYGRPIGRAAGLERLGLHIERLPPGHRLSYPHAEADEEEFVFVLEGVVDTWIDGHLHTMKAGDLAAFPAGTGICHTFINNGTEEARLFVGGEASKDTNRIFYPLNPGRRQQVGEACWWQDAPVREQGGHDGLPDALRRGQASG
jgi:uncharacterized cupin superfamily protein